MIAFNTAVYLQLRNWKFKYWMKRQAYTTTQCVRPGRNDEICHLRQHRFHLKNNIVFNFVYGRLAAFAAS